MVVAAVTSLAADNGRVGGQRLELVAGHGENKKSYRGERNVGRRIERRSRWLLGGRNGG